jgi:hypothetical protein
MKLLSTLILIVCIGCATASDISLRKKDLSSVELGAIGSIDASETSTRFNVTAIPRLNERIRIEISEKPFDKASAKKYYKVNSSSNNQLSASDSLSDKSSYIELSIGDKVTWLSALNADQNREIISYLKSTESPVLISKIDIRLPSDIQSELFSSDEAYLIGNERKGYLIEIYKDEEFIKNINLKAGTIFDFSAQEFCWYENKKHQIVVSDISDTGCAKPMSKSYQKALKKKSDYVF